MAISRVIEVCYESLRGRTDATLEEFAKFTDDFYVHPFHHSGELIGGVLIKGPEIHACILPAYKGKWVNRQLFRIIDDVVHQNGYAQTTATTQDGVDFVKRLGFKLMGDGKWVLNQSYQSQRQ